jgi:hypothetical protein
VIHSEVHKWWHLPYLPSKVTACPTGKNNEALLQEHSSRYAPVTPPALATSAPAKVTKERSVSARKEAHYDLSSCDPGKKGKKYFYAKIRVWADPACNLYSRAVSVTRTFVSSESTKAFMRAILAIVASILRRSVCHQTAARRSELSPASPQHNYPTQDAPPLFVVNTPARADPGRAFLLPYQYTP